MEGGRKDMGGEAQTPKLWVANGEQQDGQLVTCCMEDSGMWLGYIATSDVMQQAAATFW